MIQIAMLIKQLKKSGSGRIKKNKKKKGMVESLIAKKKKIIIG